MKMSYDLCSIPGINYIRVWIGLIDKNNTSEGYSTLAET